MDNCGTNAETKIISVLSTCLLVSGQDKSSEESASGGVLEGDEIISSDRSLDYHR